jgi:hypothetical protein
MQMRHVSFSAAARAVGMYRETIARLASRGYALRHPDWEREVKQVLIVRRANRWYLAETPPSAEWEGCVDPSGRRVLYLSKIPGGPK